jgi:hypothetical protein
VWDKARETLDLTQSVTYTNARGTKTHSTYVYYGHRNAPLGMALGHYSLLPNTPDHIKKQVHNEIGNIVVDLADTSRSVFLLNTIIKQLLDVNDKYQIMEVFDHKNVDQENTMRGFVTQFCVGVNYWYIIHINKYFYYTSTLSCLSMDSNDKYILFYFLFLSYRVAFPMRSGDVVCFKPLIYHCCTDPVKY